MICHQVWHAYDAGHGLRAASIALSPDERALLDDLTDLAGYLEPGQGFTHYDMGYPCGRFYAFSRTWPDLENQRPGTVQTHSFLLSPQDAQLLPDPRVLDNAFFPRPFRERSSPAFSLEINPAPVTQPVTPFEERVRLIDSWFGTDVRPLILRSHAAESVAWLWRRLPAWQRSRLAYCTYTVRARSLRHRPFDILGAAPGSRFSQGHDSVPKLSDIAREDLRILVDEGAAQQFWQAAALEGVGEVDARLWARFRSLEKNADANPAAALGALDLLPAFLATNDGVALRGRVVDRVIRPLEQRAAGEQVPGELANLAVRDLDRVVEGANRRLNLVLEAFLRARLPMLDAADLSATAGLLRAAARGGRGEVIDRVLTEVLVSSSSAALWEVAWMVRSDAAWQVWQQLPNRRREEVGPILLKLSLSALGGMFPFVFEDDDLWSWVETRDEVIGFVGAELERLIAAGQDWPPDRRMRLPAQRLAPRFLASSAPLPPPILRRAIAGRFCEEPEALPAAPEQVPQWLIAEWARYTSVGDLGNLLGARPRVFSRIVAALAEHDPNEGLDRWEAMLSAASGDALLDIPGPESVPGRADLRARWARKVGPIAIERYIDSRIELDKCAAWVAVAHDDQRVVDALEGVPIRSAERVISLLRHPMAAWLRRRPDIVLQAIARWMHTDNLLDGGGSEVLCAFLLELRSDSPTAYEAAASGILAGILEHPAPQLAKLAAETFPILHDRLCKDRKEHWLIRMLEHLWGGDWDRAGHLRERYARAWFDARWSGTNLWDAAAHDSRLFKQLLREVKHLSEGRQRLRGIRDFLPDSARELVDDVL